MANKPSKRAVPVPPKKAVQKPTTQAKATLPLQKEKTGKMSMTTMLAWALGAVSVLIYLNTLKNGYVLDDFTVIKDNAIVKQGMSAIPEILSTPYRRGFFITPNDLYRPLSLVMFAVEYQFWGLNPLPNHLVNTLLYGGCVMLFFLFLNQLFEKKRTGVAFIAALLFALHPIHTEVTANIKSRDELLCFFFAFLSLNVFLSYLASGKTSRLLLGFLCFCLSLFSKETTVTFLAIIPLIFYFYRNENRKRSNYIMAASVVAVVLFLMARTSVLSFYHANEVASIKKIDNFLAAKDITTEARLATAILILGYYVKLLFVPYPLISDYSFNSIPLVHFSDPVVLLTLALYIFLAAFAVFNIVKRRKNYMAFAFLFFLITISLFSNIILLIGTNMGERLMFFPSVGFCIAIALLIEQFAKDATGTAIGFLKNAKVLAIIVPVALIYMVITVNRNTDWFSNYTLYTKDIPKAPNSSRLNYLLGTEIETNAGDEKDPVKKKATQDSVITYLKRSLAICPDYSEAECNLGYEYFLNLQFDSAEYHTKRSIELTHNQDNAVNNLAAIYINESKFTEAINLCKSAIALNPYAVNPYVNMAACYLNIHKYDSAIIFSRKAIDIDRSNSRSYLFISIAYKAMGRIDSANIYEAMSKKQ